MELEVVEREPSVESVDGGVVLEFVAPEPCSDTEAPCPSADELDLACVLGALSDPIRLRIVAELAGGGERLCGAFELPVAKSTCSHHFRVLREAGVLCQRIDGKNRFNRLNADVLEERFPGLLRAVLRARELEDVPEE